VRNREAESLAPLRAHPAVESVDIRTPSLEEIFVAYMRQGQSAPDKAAATANRDGQKTELASSD
jgi:hypothetical protein